MEPELHEDDTIIGQHPFERADAFEFPAELALVTLAHHAIDDRACVPGAEEHADPTVTGHRPPESVEVRALGLLVAAIPEGVGHDATRIEPLVEAVDQLALPGAVGAGDDDDDLSLEAAERGMRREQSRPEPLDSCVIPR